MVSCLSLLDWKNWNGLSKKSDFLTVDAGILQLSFVPSVAFRYPEDLFSFITKKYGCAVEKNDFGSI